MVAENGQVVYSAAFGKDDIAWDISNTIDTKFRIYSLSKQFTAMIVMQLLEQGKIDLHVSISLYLPWYRLDVATKLTVHPQLIHTHGIEVGYNRLPASLLTELTQELVEKYFRNPLGFDPGSQFC